MEQVGKLLLNFSSEKECNVTNSKSEFLIDFDLIKEKYPLLDLFSINRN